MSSFIEQLTEKSGLKDWVLIESEGDPTVEGEEEVAPEVLERLRVHLQSCACVRFHHVDRPEEVGLFVYDKFVRAAGESGLWVLVDSLKAAVRGHLAARAQ